MWPNINCSSKCAGPQQLSVGHAHTNNSVKEFLQADFQVAYYHLSDNDGRRDQHLPIGKGTIEWDQLGEINKAIIELNDYRAVKQSRDTLIRVS